MHVTLQATPPLPLALSPLFLLLSSLLFLPPSIPQRRAGKAGCRGLQVFTCFVYTCISLLTPFLSLSLFTCISLLPPFLSLSLPAFLSSLPFSLSLSTCISLLLSTFPPSCRRDLVCMHPLFRVPPADQAIGPSARPARPAGILLELHQPGRPPPGQIHRKGKRPVARPHPSPPESNPTPRSRPHPARAAPSCPGGCPCRPLAIALITATVATTGRRAHRRLAQAGPAAAKRLGRWAGRALRRGCACRAGPRWRPHHGPGPDQSTS